MMIASSITAPNGEQGFREHNHRFRCLKASVV
jgi:hypothetical protein